MPKSSPQIRAEDVARFRLRRHHLLDEAPADAVTICRDMCGVQAQVMSAAYLQLWTRNHSITRPQIEEALWHTRTLVKTSLMRQTLHLIPADEFQLYIAAMRSSRLAGALRIMAKFGITRDEADALTVLIMETLRAGPLGRSAIHAAVRPKVSRRVRAWMERVWSIMRIPVAEGMICYGCGDSNEISFIRVDHWLPNLKPKPISESEAQCALFRKYLGAYGPATPADFSHWAGVPMAQAKSAHALVKPELEEVSGGKANWCLLREDVSILNDNRGKRTPHSLRSSDGGFQCVRLLPSFDSYLLAHREKDHLLSAKHYKLVYRNQGWISAVVLIDGAIAGVWSYKPQNRKLLVDIKPFGKLSRAVRAGIEREAEQLAVFYGSELERRFA